MALPLPVLIPCTIKIQRLRLDNEDWVKTFEVGQPNKEEDLGKLGSMWWIRTR